MSDHEVIQTLLLGAKIGVLLLIVMWMFEGILRLINFFKLR